jgi:large subunit ribosomal protein L32e
MSKKFIRQDFMRFSKLGKGRKKLQKWRKPKGRDSKMREGRRSYPAVVRLGYKTDKKESGKINGKHPVVVRNVGDLSGLGKKNAVIIGRIGAKKRIDVINKAMEMKLELVNVKREASG